MKCYGIILMNVKSGGTMVSEKMFKQLNLNLLVKDMRSGLLVLKKDTDYPQDPSNYIIVDIKRSVKTVLSKTTQNLMGKKLHEVFNLSEDHYEMLSEVIQSGLSHQREFYLERIDEWLSITLYYSRQEYLTVVFENITEKKRTEEKLVHSENTMSRTLEVTGEGVWEWRMDGTVTHNKQWAEILGLDNSKVMHHYEDYVSHLHPEDRESVLKQVHCAKETGEIFHQKYRLIRKDGQTIWVEDRGVAIVDENGQFERMIGSMNEITDYIETQEKLNTEKEILKSTLLSVGDGIIATDVDGYITIMNPVASDFTGWDTDEAIGKNVKDVFFMKNPETRESLYKFNLNDLEEHDYPSLQNQEALVMSKLGEEFYMNCSISPIRLSDNQLAGLVITFRDITEVVKYQREIEYISYHDDLTGLYNRRYIMEALENLNHKGSLPLTIMIIDINDLKMANDHFGHAVGDQLIRKTATVLRAFFWDSGIISRTGGDEFLILLPKTTKTEAEEMKLQVYMEMSKHHLKKAPLSVAIGLATKRYPEEDVDRIMRAADNDMYYNKRIIKNEV